MLSAYLGMMDATEGGVLAFPLHPDVNCQREVICGHSFGGREEVQ